MSRSILVIISIAISTLTIIHWWYHRQPARSIDLQALLDESNAQACATELSLNGTHGGYNWKLSADHVRYSRENRLHVVHMRGNILTDVTLSSDPALQPPH